MGAGRCGEDMTEIVIHHCGRISNVDALKACIAFVDENRSAPAYQADRIVATEKGIEVAVKELKHGNQEESPCSVIFDVAVVSQEGVA